MMQHLVTNAILGWLLSLIVIIPAESAEPAVGPDSSQLLFDGKTLAGWVASDFEQKGTASVADGELVIHAGQSMSGITWQKDFPTSNYEVTLDAKRVEGSDFFCGLTFPVGDEFCTFVVGGWSGTVVGLSCIDGLDASDNQTTMFADFKNDRWYKIRLRVSDAMIKAWIDDEEFVSVNRRGKEFSLRFEVDPSRPFGISTYETTAAVRDIRVRQFLPDTNHPGTIRAELDVPYAGTGHPRQRLDLLLPSRRNSKDPLPVIAYIHGGAWLKGDKRSGIDFLKPFVASGDYAGVTIGYRLSSDATWPAQIHDCKAAVRWVRAVASRYNLDPQRIAAVGHSAGGHLVSMLGTSAGVESHEGELGAARGYASGVRCVIDFFGPSDFRTIGDFPSRLKHNSADSPEARLLGGAIGELPDAARSASPVAFASSDDAPFLIIHGTEDETVPYHQSQELKQALEAAGVSATLVSVDGGGHGGLNGAGVKKSVADFLEFHLLDRHRNIQDKTLQPDE